MRRSGRARATIIIAVPRLPRIANFDDLDPLRAEPGVNLVIVEPGQPSRAMPISSSCPAPRPPAPISRLCARNGWDIDILAHHRAGGRVLGICGGYQMLGKTIADPDGIEGTPGTSAGPGPARCRDRADAGQATAARERRACRNGPADRRLSHAYGRNRRARIGPVPSPMSATTAEGAISADGWSCGTYLHGLFAADDFRAGFLGST